MRTLAGLDGMGSAGLKRRARRRETGAPRPESPPEGSIQPDGARRVAYTLLNGGRQDDFTRNGHYRVRSRKFAVDTPPRRAGKSGSLPNIAQKWSAGFFALSVEVLLCTADKRTRHGGP